MALYQKYGVLDKTMIMVTGLRGADSPKASNAKMGAPKQTAIPWLAWGVNVKPGYAIPDRVNIMDVGATVLEALGLETHTEWESRAVDGHLSKATRTKDNGK